MRKLFIVLLTLIVGFSLTLAINGNGPGDGIPDGPDDGSGYGSDDNGNGQGPGKGKTVENTQEFTALENPEINNDKNEEDFMFKLMRKIAEMFQNIFKRMLSVKNVVE